MHSRQRSRAQPADAGLPLTTDSLTFLSSVAFWHRDFCGVALKVNAAYCS